MCPQVPADQPPGEEFVRPAILPQQAAAATLLPQLVRFHVVRGCSGCGGGSPRGRERRLHPLVPHHGHPDLVDELFWPTAARAAATPTTAAAAFTTAATASAATHGCQSCK